MGVTHIPGGKTLLKIILESLPAVALNPLLPASSTAGPSFPAAAGRESPQ